MKLKNYIPLLIIFAALNLNAREPSIIVHDYNPDVYIRNEGKDTLKIDFNNDEVLDLVFYLVVRSGGEYPTIKSLYKNCRLTLISDSVNNSLQSTTLSWSTELTYLLGMFTSEKIGIKIIENEKIYYGWVHAIFSIENREAVIRIDKYAYCNIPDYPLLWGQTELTGVKDIKDQDKIKVSVNGQSKSINIQSKEVIKEISLINSSGRVMQKWRNLKSSKVDIPSGGITGGIYLIRVKTLNNEVFTEKVVL